MAKEIKFIDLFCGCGGWTEGFTQLGYKCVYAVDFWQPAAKTHSLNHPGIEDDERAKDVLSSEVFGRIKDLLKSGNADILIGSPPCTQFSFSNRGGNGNTAEGMILVRRYLEAVDYVQNKLKKKDFPWVLENVPRVKDFLQKECIDEKNGLYRLNYIDRPKVFYTIHIPKTAILNAADYGSAQKRQRFFCGNFLIPEPTHISPDIKGDHLLRAEFIQRYGLESVPDNLKDWVKLKDILNGLPNPLSKKDRNKKLTDPNYKDLTISEDKLHDHFYDTRVSPGLELYQCQELKQHHPIYGVMNFPDDLDRPARTIMATEMEVSRETMFIPVHFKKYNGECGKKSYNEVLSEHYDKKVGGFRRLTIREVATLQGFPITFQFWGDSSTIKHKQVGNAVSPMISRAFARMFLKAFFNKKSISKSTKIYPIIKDDSYDSYEKASAWAPKESKKNSKKFFKHLRSTKSGGQRIDFYYDGTKDALWQVLLCLGSGKEYKSIAFDDALLERFVAKWKESFRQDIFNDPSTIDSWLDKLHDSVFEQKLSFFNNYELERCFSADGKYIQGSPVYFIEEGVDEIIQAVTGKDYANLRSKNAKVYIDALKDARDISLYVSLALFVSCKILGRVNGKVSNSTIVCSAGQV